MSGLSISEELVAQVQRQDELLGRMAGELERLGKGIERVAAKYGADHPVVADALHRLLRGRPMADSNADSAALLVGHEGYVWQRAAGGFTCRCDAPLTEPGSPAREWDAREVWRQHVAQVLCVAAAVAK